LPFAAQSSHPASTIAGVLTPEDINRLRERLEHDRAEIQARIAARSREIEATVPPEDEIGDEGDEAKAVTDLEPTLAENELDEETLARIERALQRIEEGTYGLSEVSGKPIPIERLEAVPYATTLVDEQPPEPA
jgi:DnaK suppressor protein